MAKTDAVLDLERTLDDLLATLLRDCGGSRSTLRIDDSTRGWEVNFVCAEALQPGCRSLRGDGSIDQRAAGTAQWLLRYKRNLLQDDLTGNPDPAPPPALISMYAAKAQMLGPMFSRDGHLAGWNSVHYIDGPHACSAEDAAALDRARAEVMRLTGIGA